MQRIGKYEIVGTLGEGGMGMVYKGRDTVIGRDVAIKVIQDRLLTKDASIRDRFYREGRSAGRLTHDNITVLYDLFEEDGKPCIVMEYLEGGDLSERLQQGPPLTVDEKLSVIRQVLRGLQYAHEQGVVHRDVKPANIRLLPDGRVKIMDFGIARLQSDTVAPTLTKTSASLGTPRYMAPEQVKGERVDRRADIFAVGVLFYELLMGTNPFPGERITTIIYKIVHAEPQPLEIHPDDLNAALRPIVMKCLEKNPDARYQTCAEVLADLDAATWGSDETVAIDTSPLATQGRTLDGGRRTGMRTQDRTAVGRETTTDPPAETSSGGRGLKIALAALVVVGLAGGGYWIATSGSVASDPAMTSSVGTEPDAADAATPTPAEANDTSGEVAADPPVEAPATLPSADAPAGSDATEDPSSVDTAARSAAQAARQRMDRARQPVRSRLQEAAVASLAGQAYQVRVQGIEQQDDGRFAAAEASFDRAAELYDEIQRVLAAQDEAARAAAEAEVDEPPAEATEPATPSESPAVIAARQAAEDARAAMQTAKQQVRSDAQASAPYREGQAAERDAATAYASDDYARAQVQYDVARSRYAAAAALPTPAQEVQAAVTRLTATLASYMETENVEGLQSMQYEGWGQFFDFAEVVEATVRAGDARISGDQARVDIQLRLAYRDNKNRPQESGTAYTWVLSRSGGAWTLSQVIAQ